MEAGKAERGARGQGDWWRQKKRGWIDGFQMNFEEEFIGLAHGLDTRWGAGDYQRGIKRVPGS